MIINDAIEQIKEELKRLVKNGMPAEEFREMVDLLVKASALALPGGRLPDKFYRDGFTFLKAGKGYVVVKEPEHKP